MLHIISRINELLFPNTLEFLVAVDSSLTRFEIWLLRPQQGHEVHFTHSHTVMNSAERVQISKLTGSSPEAVLANIAALHNINAGDITKLPKPAADFSFIARTPSRKQSMEPDSERLARLSISKTPSRTSVASKRRNSSHSDENSEGHVGAALSNDHQFQSRRPCPHCTTTFESPQGLYRHVFVAHQYPAMSRLPPSQRAVLLHKLAHMLRSRNAESLSYC